MKFHSFYTTDLSNEIVKTHKACCDKHGVDITYHAESPDMAYDEIYKAHGDFMNRIVENSTDDVVGFLDIDCLPHDGKILKQASDWVKENRSFVGNAQNVSHDVMRNRIYAAASMLIISKSGWEQLGKPSFSFFRNEQGHQIDTAQLLTLRADEVGMPYRLMYPIGYDGRKSWQLGGYGSYGKGTLYPATWHYFRISALKAKVPDLWHRRVKNILNDEEIIPNFPSLPYGVSDWKISVKKFFQILTPVR